MRGSEREGGGVESKGERKIGKGKTEGRWKRKKEGGRARKREKLRER